MNSAKQLDLIGAEVSRLVEIVSRMWPASYAETKGGKSANWPTLADAFRGFLVARRKRAEFFPANLFADPAWDMILDLMVARLEDKEVSISSLCIASAVPATTALRWVKALTDGGFIKRIPDKNDARRIYVALTDEACNALLSWVVSVGVLPSALVEHARIRLGSSIASGAGLLAINDLTDLRMTTTS